MAEVPKHYKYLFTAMALCLVILIVFLYAWPERRVTFYVSMAVLVIFMVIMAGFQWPENWRDLPWLGRGRDSDDSEETVSPGDRFDAVSGMVLSILYVALAVGIVVTVIHIVVTTEGSRRHVDAIDTAGAYERAAVTILLDARAQSFYNLFDDVDAAAKTCGGHQELWNTVIPALLQDGRNAQLKHVKPDLLTRLGTGYIEELQPDPWGNPYQFYAPPHGDAEEPVFVWSMGPDGISSWSADNAPGAKAPDLEGDDVYF